MSTAGRWSSIRSETSSPNTRHLITQFVIMIASNFYLQQWQADVLDVKTLRNGFNIIIDFSGAGFSNFVINTESRKVKFHGKFDEISGWRVQFNSHWGVTPVRVRQINLANAGEISRKIQGDLMESSEKFRWNFTGFIVGAAVRMLKWVTPAKIMERLVVKSDFSGIVSPEVLPVSLGGQFFHYFWISLLSVFMRSDVATVCTCGITAR